jgi:hypothetical protein
MRPHSSILSALASALVSLTLWSAPAVSEQLEMVPPPAKSTASRPGRGTTMEKVEATYGAPTRKIAPVGQPPIERWEYPSFTVYFEYRKVVHSVGVAS